MNTPAIEARAIVERWAGETKAIPAGKNRDALVKHIFVALTQRETMIRKDYEEVLSDKRRLTKELDVLMGGTAKQPSLCDVVGYFPIWQRKVETRVRRGQILKFLEILLDPEITAEADEWRMALALTLSERKATRAKEPA